MSRLLWNSTPWERERGLVFAEKFRNQAEVEQNNGTPTNSPTINRGLILPGGGTQHVVTRIPPDLLSGGVNSYLTFVIEFTPDFAYNALVDADLMQTTAGNLFYFRKRSSDGDVRFAIHGTLVDSWDPSTIQSYWVNGGRNVIVCCAKSGDSYAWLNGVLLTNAIASSWTVTEPTEIYHGIANNGTSTQFDGTIHSVRIFDSPDKFTQEDADYYWDTDRGDPIRKAAGYWFLDAARATATQALDVTRNELHLTLGDGAGSNLPTKLADRHGYDMAGTTYFKRADTLPMVASSEFTLETCFKSDDITGFQATIGRYGTEVNYRVRIDDGKVEFIFRESTNSTNRQWEETGDSIRAGVWCHLVFQHKFGDGTSTRCFLNGQEIPGAWIAGGSDQPYEETATLYVGVGRLLPALDQPLDGDIYDAGVWNEYLSSLEILELYTTARNRINYL
jgi:hypothetical protein